MFWKCNIFADFKTRVHMATAKLSEKHEEKAFSSSASPTSKAVWKKATPKLKYHYKNQHSVWKSQKKVAFSIASEASYVYILSGQKFIKNAKNDQFWRFFENLKFAVIKCYQIGQF